MSEPQNDPPASDVADVEYQEAIKWLETATEISRIERDPWPRSFRTIGGLILALAIACVVSIYVLG
jgi:hypothetical protein